VFFTLDMSGWRWLDKYRLHEPAEVAARNRATVGQVVRAVIVQQIIQTALGYWWMQGEDEHQTNHVRAMDALYNPVYQTLMFLVGPSNAASVLVRHGSSIISAVYWWLIPVAQFMLAFFIIDTWQYFLHRLFHTNKFLYRHFHSVHHRLYVPYAFGALYNHWVEGLLLDTLGAALAHSLSFMTIRQATLLFTFSTLKTIDDHSSYAFPLDPFQAFFPNNSSYHDIHHQAWGIKYNFSQPFYVHWDTLLGTRYKPKNSRPSSPLPPPTEKSKAD